MYISIRNAAGSRTEVVEKQVIAGRTVIRLGRGERLEVVDESTQRAPAQMRVSRAGERGQDLVLEHAGEVVQVEGFFEMAAEGEEAVAVAFPGGEVAQITPASELAGGEWASGAAFAATEASGAMTSLTTAGSASLAMAGASAAGTAGSGVAAGSASTVWWVLGGLAVVGGGIAIANDDDDDDAPAPAPAPAPQPTFSLTASASEADEGEDVVFTLSTTNVAAGTQYEYEISGVSSSDVAGGKLTGTVTIDANGKALIPVSLLEDLKTEGVETLKLTIAGQTVELKVNDTSLTPVPTFALTADAESVDEGADVTFTLTTTNVAPGTQYEYQISGVSAADVVGGKLTGTVTIDANGRALIPISLVADLKSEGAETLKVTIAGRSYEVSVNDTSTTPVPTYALT